MNQATDLSGTATDSDELDPDELPPVLTLAAKDADAGLRLDAFIAASESRLSRSRSTALIDAGAVTVDGVLPKRASHKLRGNEKVVVTMPVSSAPADAPMLAEDLPLQIIYDDDDLCVIDKAAGMVVHPGAGHDSGTIANALLFRFPNLSVGGARRPGIVHRLDKETSGLLVVAKNDETLKKLAAQFSGTDGLGGLVEGTGDGSVDHGSERSVDKGYIAVCFGLAGPPGVEVEVITGHDRSERDRRRYTTRLDPPPDGITVGQWRLAHTCFTVRHAAGTLSVVDIRLLTGRTHQIRAHFADRGHPLLQDDLYGGVHIERRLQNGPIRDIVVQLRRHALHASSLSFNHPRTGKRLSFTSPLPPDMAAVVDAIALASLTDSRA